MLDFTTVVISSSIYGWTLQWKEIPGSASFWSPVVTQRMCTYSNDTGISMIHTIGPGLGPSSVLGRKPTRDKESGQSPAGLLVWPMHQPCPLPRGIGTNSRAQKPSQNPTSCGTRRVRVSELLLYHSGLLHLCALYQRVVLYVTNQHNHFTCTTWQVQAVLGRRWGVVVIDPGVTVPKLETWLYHLLAMWHWQS